jgi:hypothetical protein
MVSQNTLTSLNSTLIWSAHGSTTTSTSMLNSTTMIWSPNISRKRPLVRYLPPRQRLS